MKKRYKKVAESQTEQTYLMRPMYLNGYGNLFGGQLMSWIDEIASIVAMRHSESDITTAAIDNLNFKSGATVEDVIVLREKSLMWAALLWRYGWIPMWRTVTASGK